MTVSTKTTPLDKVGACGLCCFWLAPDGTATFISDEAGHGSHGGLAEYALGDITRGRGLDEKGYVHVSYGDVFKGYNARSGITQAQLDTLMDIDAELTRRHMAPLYLKDFLKNNEVMS